MVGGNFKVYKVLAPHHMGSFALHCSFCGWYGSKVAMVWLSSWNSNYLKLKGAVVAGEAQVCHNLRQEVWLHSNRNRKWNCRIIPNQDICSINCSVGPRSLISASLLVCSPLLYLQSHFLCCSLHTQDGCPTASEVVFYPPFPGSYQDGPESHSPHAVRDFLIGPSWARCLSQSNMR